MPGVLPRPPVRGEAVELPRLAGVLGGVLRAPEGPEEDISWENLHFLPNLQLPFVKLKQGLWLQVELVGKLFDPQYA